MTVRHLTEQTLKQIRAEAQNYNVKELSEATGLPRSTLFAFLSGRTEWPRPKTLFTLLEFFGYDLKIVRRNSTPIYLRRVK